MNSRLSGIAAFLFFIVAQAFAASSSSEPQVAPRFAWIQAPAQGEIAKKAQIKLDDDLMFLGSEETQKFLVATGNPSFPNNFTLASKKFKWFAIFNFNDDGYVKDDEKIDPDALLQTLKASNEKGLELRRQQNLPLVYLDGWYIPPRYDSETKRLEWATKLHNQNNEQLEKIGDSPRFLTHLRHLLATNPFTFEQSLRILEGRICTARLISLPVIN
jgi:uncharacterized membrane-anchored protein